jgi:hypothetical protein
VSERVQVIGNLEAHSCPNRACGMCPDYRPAPLIHADAAEIAKRLDEMDDAIRVIRGFLVL